MISLYFHIPFCTKKCPYCHFYVTANDPKNHILLLEALRKEWAHQKSKTADQEIASVYFGGGTPALFGPDNIAEILSWIQPSPQCEITLEANPQEITLELLQGYRKAGVNRLSIGLQSLDNALLKQLGRTHSAETAREALFLAKEALFENVSIDLMVEVPGQTLASWEETLEELKNLPFTHLSLYNLTFEPHTPFFRKRKELAALLPSEEDKLRMLEIAVDSLQAQGLKRYEISAFAKSGFESRHNTGYWIGRPFLGFGPSAFSYWEGKRFRNISNLAKYAEKLAEGTSAVDFEEKLSEEGSQRELLAIALRRVEGVDRTQYRVPDALYQKLASEGYLHLEGPRAALTEKGLLFYDTVAEEIIL